MRPPGTTSSTSLLEYRLGRRRQGRGDAREIKERCRSKITEQRRWRSSRNVHDDRAHGAASTRRSSAGCRRTILASHQRPRRERAKSRSRPTRPDTCPAVLKFANSAELRQQAVPRRRTQVGLPAPTPRALRGLLTAAAGAGAPARLRHLGGLCDGRPDDRLAREAGRVRRQGRCGLARAGRAREDAALLAFAKQREPSTAEDLGRGCALLAQEQYRRARVQLRLAERAPYFPYAAGRAEA